MTQPADTLRLDSPSGKKELALLDILPVGEKRASPLFPTLPNMEWELVSKSAERWEFNGLFCDQLVMQVAIVAKDSVLQLVVLPCN